MRSRIGECLIQAGLITEGDLDRALVEQRRSGDRLGAVLVRMNLAMEDQIAKALGRQLGFLFVSLVESPPDLAAVTWIPREVARECVCIAIGRQADTLTIAMADPLQLSLVQDLEMRTGHRIRQVIATRDDILAAIDACYPDEAPALVAEAAAGASSLSGFAGFSFGGEALIHGKDEEWSVPVAAPSESIDLAGLVVKSGIESKASDIHVEPLERWVVIRHRVDGMLKEVMQLPAGVRDELLGRLKAMAGMDPGEIRLPQEGRLRATAADGREVDFRVSTLRTLFGEKIVMRLIEHRKEVPALDELGMSGTAVDTFREILGCGQGLILVAGPSGCGKSTTLGAALGALRSARTNIVTIEDPVEYLIPGVSQTQINEKINLTFACALRSALRQDPDVVLVGEIRDGETAFLAVQAAHAGRLVLSAMPGREAVSSITRLMELAGEPNVLAAALVGVVAQRLVRCLCEHCRRPQRPMPDTLRSMDVSDAEAAALTLYGPVGCDECNHTGYRGRTGIFEVMKVTDSIRRLISSRAPDDQLRRAAMDAGMVRLSEEGMAKVKSGLTTPEELIRVVAEVRDVRALCPDCGFAVGVDFNACPSCGKRLAAGCPHCGRALQPGWNYCPYCARSTTEATRVKRPAASPRNAPDGAD